MKSASSVLVPLILVILFGKLIPLIALTLILVGLVIILQAAIKEGRQL